jgi:hypothetical protein
LCQKEFFSSSPKLILVAVAKDKQSVLLQGVSRSTQEASGFAHSSQSHCSQSALANLSMSRTPRPSRFIRRVTFFQLTLHLPPNRLSRAQRNLLLSLSIFCSTPLGALSMLLGSCFGAPKVSHEEAASAEVVSKRWPKVPFHGASAF